MLNIIGGLFIGFTFFKTGDSIQDSQNKLFVSRVVCMSLIFSLTISQAIFMATVLVRWIHVQC
jgi:ATP-binding cassette subfamily G (WHITE) protein 2 (SNQ2)